MELSLIIATDEEWGIGNSALETNNPSKRYSSLSWYLPEDLKFFKDTTEGGTVIMGRKTFESMGSKALPNRVNIVVSTTLDSSQNSIGVEESGFGGLAIVPSLEKAIKLASNLSTKSFLIGGANLIDSVVGKYCISNVYLTRVSGTFGCDVKLSLNTINLIKGSLKINEFTNYIDSRSLVHYSRGLVTLKSQETRYLELMYDTIDCPLRPNRTEVNTYSSFGKSLEFSLRGNKVALLDTKRVAWKSVLVELLWFLSGDTSTNALEKYNVKIWRGNTTREFLDSNGKQHIKEGDIGDGYGWQWRHMNGETDQIKDLLELLKTDPYSRRMVLSAWNPISFKNCALPPCHVLFQLYASPVEDDQLSFELDIQVYQRSADLFLGVPFNLASYSILCHVFCHLANIDGKYLYTPGRLLFTFGDAHVYESHMDQVVEQLKRSPIREFPSLSISDKVTKLEDLYDLKDYSLNIEAFTLLNYSPQATIKALMTV